MAELNSIQIQALVREMDASMRRHKGLRNTNPAEFRKKVSAENEILYNRYATVFEMHISGKLDQTFFDMLKLRRKIELGEITEDEASRLVGQQLFDRFVDPVIKNTPPPAPVGSYSEYYKNLGDKEEN